MSVLPGMMPAMATASVFDPLSLSPHFLFDFSDTSSLWQNTAGSTAVTASGQQIQRADDLSGNGRHITHTGGPDYIESGGKGFSRFTAGEYLADSFTTTGLTDVAFWFAISANAVNSIALTAAASSANFVACAQNGDTVNGPDNQTSEYRLDGIQLSSPSRDSFYDNYAGQGTLVLEVRGHDMSAWSNIRYGGYGGSFQFAGDIYAAMCVDSSVSSANEAKIRAWMADKF